MALDNEQWHYQFIHNVFGCFIETTLDYFGDFLYPRFEYKIVGTYDKAVQYIVNQEKLGREVDKPNLPALILNPSGDFGLDDTNSGAKQFWRFPHLAPYLAQRIFDPIYVDQNVTVTVAFTRLKGEIELLALLPSFYEYFDLKLFIIQMFGGEGRYLQPMLFNDFIILPPDLVNYRYYNDVTGEDYILDWKENGAYEFLVQTTNKNELIIPGKIKPRYVLRGMSDGSARHGGLDDIADWRLSSIIEYEIEIPSYIILKSDIKIENVKFDIGYGSAYTKYPQYNVPTSQITLDTHINSDDAIKVALCSGEKIERYLMLKNRYFHIVTEEQANSTTNVTITLPEKIYDESLLKVQTKNGLLAYGDNYDLSTSGDELTFIIKNTKLIKNEFIELFVYAVPYGSENPIHVYGGSSLVSTTQDSPNRAHLIVKWALTSTSKCEIIINGEI